MLKIRLAEEKDLLIISELYIANWKETYKGLVNQDYLDALNVPWAVEKWTNYIKQPKQGIYIAEKGDQLMGFGAFKPEPTIENCLFLDALHVTKDARGLGIGSKLINTIGKRAVEEGYSKMNISIVSGNEHARRLYVNRGVTHYEFEKIDFAGKTSNVEMFVWETLDAFK